MVAGRSGVNTITVPCHVMAGQDAKFGRAMLRCLKMAEKCAKEKKRNAKSVIQYYALVSSVMYSILICLSIFRCFSKI